MGAGVILGIGVARWSGSALLLDRAVGGLGLALLAGVTVSFASGEWHGGVVYPLWDAFQATTAYAMSLALGRYLAGRRTRHQEG